MLPEHVCEFCSGAGIEFGAGGAPVPCLLCDGSGYATLLGDLGPTHTQPRRPFTYTPAARILSVGIGSRRTSYTIAKFRPDAGFEGRAFTLTKRDGTGHYSCLVGTTRGACDCAGAIYLSTEKANLRSWLRDDREFPSAGCKHLDALRVLLEGGWLDLPEHVPLYPSED
jgi:hypothetical protein